VSNLIESLFPDLVAAGYHVTSPATPNYNCIAWAAEDETAWWWPDLFGDYYWPPQVPRAETLAAFIEAYATLGYQLCLDSDTEQDFEKIVIYVNVQGIPTHAARQLPTGNWTSKLGQLEDIQHSTLDGLCGDLYGQVGATLKRSVR
jgi:hypothetical protein